MWLIRSDCFHFTHRDTEGQRVSVTIKIVTMATTNCFPGPNVHAEYVLFVIFQTVELTDEETEAQRGVNCWGHTATE